MLFFNTTQPVDRNCDARYRGGNESDVGHSRFDKSDMLWKVTVALTIIYSLVSVVVSLLDWPISLCALVVPFLVMIFTALAIKSMIASNLWLCSIAATLGTFGKILSIIIFWMAYGYSRINDEYELSPGTSKQRNLGRRQTGRFFIALFIVEAFFMALLICVRCNVRLFRKFLR